MNCFYCDRVITGEGYIYAVITDPNDQRNRVRFHPNCYEAFEAEIDKLDSKFYQSKVLMIGGDDPKDH